MLKMKKARRVYRLSHVLKKVYKSTFYLSIVLWRRSFLYDGHEEKRKALKGQPLTKESRKKLADFWSGIPIDESWHQFYNWVEKDGMEEKFDPRYIPLDMEYCCIDDWFNDTESSLLLDDKNFYDLYFPDILQPKTIVRIIDGRLLDSQFSPIDLDSAVAKCQEMCSIISKPAVDSSCGSGIKIWHTVDGKQPLVNILTQKGSHVIQEVIKQHPNISKLHENSINTIRIVTCYLDGEMQVLSSVIRMGANGSMVDNTTAGGLFCGIKDDGHLKKYGYTKMGVAVTEHPQGAVFADCVIPNFDKCKELVCRMAYRFIRTSKLVSWDLAINEDGEPVLIEVNLCYGGTNIHQIANGPIFGDKTKYIVSEVFKYKKYRWVNRILR